MLLLVSCMSMSWHVAAGELTAVLMCCQGSVYMLSHDAHGQSLAAQPGLASHAFNGLTAAVHGTVGVVVQQCCGVPCKCSLQVFPASVASLQLSGV